MALRNLAEDFTDNTNDTSTEVPTTAVVVQPKTSTALERAAQSALALKSAMAVNPLGQFAGAIPVEHNTFPNLAYNSGSFVPRDEPTKKLGDAVTIELLSYQPDFVVETGAPDADEEAKKFVRWSSDGQTVEDADGVQTTVTEYINYLHGLGYADARLKERATLVGLLHEAEKCQEFLGEVVQISLAPTAKAAFNNYLKQLVVKNALGKLPDDVNLQMMRIEIVNVTGKDKKAFNNLKFSVAS